MDRESKRYAIIVGISEYQADNQLAQLPCAKNDAIRLREILIHRGGFRKEQTYLLINGQKDLDGATNPTKGEILKRVKYVCGSALEDDVILLFFAGHGAEISKNPYLLTCDTMMDVLQQTGININELNGMLQESKAGCVLRIFDACRSPFSETRGPLVEMTRGLQDAMLKPVRGWASFSSCSSGEVAHESGEWGHGIFSYYLCAGLEENAANEDGCVTLERLVDYVKISVANWCDEQSQRQTPHVQTDMSGSLILTQIRKPMHETVSSAGPLELLRLGIEQHLGQTPLDTRNLTFTDEKEWTEVSGVAQRCIHQVIGGFSHPSMVITVKDAVPFGGGPQSLFFGDMQSKRINDEFKGQVHCLEVEFSSPEVVVPRSRLTVVVGRFSFFYWLWYAHICDTKQLQGTFKAQPSYAKGFFTFKPKAALDGRKIENAVKEMMKRTCEDILVWAKQLGDYVDGRLGPLREIGQIVD